MIQIKGLRKEFNGRWVTKGVDLIIPEGQMTCIIGKSGEGKSVLLKQIMGLIKPTSGQIVVDGYDITRLDQNDLEIVFKQFGYVFQFAALLDSLTVFENIGITLLEQGIDPSSIEPIIKEKLSLVNLTHDVLYKYPSELSGGMKKRVGLARTLMIPHLKVILYDEPTTGLDPVTTRVIHELMYDMQQRFNITSIVISHDVEIFKYADNIALLNEGQIRFFGDAKTIWQSDNPYVYQFIRGFSQGPIQPDAQEQVSE